MVYKGWDEILMIALISKKIRGGIKLWDTLYLEIIGPHIFVSYFSADSWSEWGKIIFKDIDN